MTYLRALLGLGILIAAWVVAAGLVGVLARAGVELFLWGWNLIPW